MMLRKPTLLLPCLLLLATGCVHASPFDQGVVSFSVTAGSGRAYNANYTVLGVGVGYYVATGLQLGLDYENWSGGYPRIQQISPRVNYVFAINSTVSPYAGVFYRKTRVEDLPDSDAYGGRAGIYLRSGRNVIMGLGAVYIEYKDCQTSVYQSCSDTYSEATLALYY